MGRGRRRSALLGALLALVPVLAACGAEEREVHNRPPQPVAVTVSLSERGVLVQPSRIGFRGQSGTNISQNEDVAQPQANRKAPLPVIFTVANLTDRDATLLIEGPSPEEADESPCPVTACSDPIVAQGTGDLKTSLPTGQYRISVRNIANGRAVPFSVGPDRPSSQQDLLLP
jgi:hypothetical protein